VRLFKYLPPTRVDVLSRLRIRFTQPLYFNDPFEFSPTIGSLIAATDEDSFIEGAIAEATGNKEDFARHFSEAIERHAGFLSPAVRAQITPEMGLAEIEPYVRPMFKEFLQLAGKHLDEKWRPETRERVGQQVSVLSLSEVNDNLLMWAHYAESHKGFAIGFDACHAYFDQRHHSEDLIRHLAPVVYSENRPAAVLLNPSLSESEQAARFSAGFLLTKSIDWQYEREWRMLRSVDEASENIDLAGELICLYDFPPEAVTDVIVGCRTSASARATLLALRTDLRFAHVQWWEACINERLFKVNIRSLAPT
jgi:hypothetical protein